VINHINTVTALYRTALCDLTFVSKTKRDEKSRETNHLKLKNYFSSTAQVLEIKNFRRVFSRELGRT